MKKLYTIAMGLSFAMIASTTFAQVNQVQKAEDPMQTLSNEVETATKVNLDVRKDDPVVYWSDDFSNGFDGQGDNGAWTTGQDQGNLWLYVFPIGQPNGYDPDAAVDNPAYNGTIPRLSSRNLSIVSSATRNNGVMLLDVDRWNSTATPEAAGATTQNPLLSTLISPTIDLSGVTGDVVLTFTEKIRQCCTGYAATAEFSTDNGSTWVPFDVFNPYGGGNDYIEENVSINITEVLATASTDLSQCKIRFFWAGSAFAYFWSLDDVTISELPANDLEIGTTYYNDFDALYSDFNTGMTSAVEYWNKFEYNNQADYLTRPFTFGAIVSNVGATAQTGVSVRVDATLPDGSVVVDYAVSEPMTMEPGVVDTIFTADVMPDVSMAGTYSFEFRVTQNEEDQVPANNTGAMQVATITTDADNGNFAINSNDARIASNSAYNTAGQDRIWGVPYTFPESTDKYITHIEAVLLNAADFAESLPGEIIYFNVRKGSVLEEDPEVPETATTVFFDSDNPLEYDAIELEHEIQESEIWYTANSSEPVWLSFQLPSPILVDANTIYQAEFRVPPAGDNIVFATIAQNNETFAGATYDFATPAWFYLGTNSLAIRFRTSADPTSVETISQENGMQLVQNYPNPFTTSTTIQYRLDETSQASLEVRDVTGKLVFNKDLGMTVGGTANTYELHRGSLAPGLYTYSIVTSENTITRKLTVQ